MVGFSQRYSSGWGAARRVVDSIYELVNSISPGEAASNWDCEQVFQTHHLVDQNFEDYLQVLTGQATRLKGAGK